jgi:CRISPR-associated protein (TIGR03986 family)
MALGKLIVIKNKTLQIQFTNTKGKDVSFSIKESELSTPLLDKKKNQLAQLNGLEVEFEEAGGQPTQVREKGSNFVSPSGNSSIGDFFHNPYNFVPAIPRNIEELKNSELGDRTPSGHICYQENLWSGKIFVTLTTVTPLLLPDAANATVNEQEHKTYPLRKGVDGKPYLPPTSIKGMLRSAYEAVTNSRLSVFEKHKDRLAYRMAAAIGLQMVPARIENGKIYLYPGTSNIKNDGTSQGAMYAAWLPRYNRQDTNISNFAVKYQGDQLPKHGQAVTAWLEKYEKIGKDKFGNDKSIFTYWRVRKIKPAGENLGSEPNPVASHGTHQPTGEDMIQVRGYVCVTNKNIDKKHDERLFFCHEQAPIEIELTSELKTKWDKLITNYQEIHQDEIFQGAKGPPALQNSQWSRHITGGDKERHLSNGTLCYAHVQRKSDKYEIRDLYPVMITRGLYEVNPESLLPESLKPANKIEELSTADRVFGWVNQEGKGSYKGQLRINSVQCKSENSIENFEENSQQGLPLAILAEPKPEQVRFYVAENTSGEPLNQGTEKATGYQQKRGLRGRKVYPHHQRPKEYWDVNAKENQVGNCYREYRRPEEIQDNQNRTIKAWVKPETNFSFEIDVINLSNVELGALIWLLQLPENHFHRLGGGKPLGFGSVKLNINHTDLRTGKQWREFYSSLLSVDKPDQTAAIKSSDCFQKAVEEIYKKTFIKVSFIDAFLKAAKGFDKPIHYPRHSKEPLADGKSYEWFVANEHDTTENNALRLSLPELTNDLGLPLSPKTPKERRR